MKLHRACRNICRLCSLGIALAFFGLCVRAQAQFAPAPSKSQISFVSGRSVGSIHLFGYADNREISLFGIKYDRHSFGHLLGAHVNYVGEIIPVFMLQEPARYGADSIALTRQKKWVYGTDIAPAGSRILWRPGKSWEPYLLGQGGVMYFTNRVLSTRGTHMQFSAEFGAGLTIKTHSPAQLRIGYSFFHFSNGDIAARNPALDSNFIYTALTFNSYKDIWRRY